MDRVTGLLREAEAQAGGVGREGRDWEVESSMAGFRVELGGRMSPPPQMGMCFLHFLPTNHPAGSAWGAGWRLGYGDGWIAATVREGVMTSPTPPPDDGLHLTGSSS